MAMRRFAPNIYRGLARRYFANPVGFRNTAMKYMRNTGLIGAGTYGLGQLTPKKEVYDRSPSRGRPTKKMKGGSRNRTMSAPPGGSVPPLSKGGSKFIKTAPFTGKYGGKFGKAKAKNKAKQSFAKFTGSGYVVRRETLGTIQDPDCCYLYAHDFPPDEMIGTIAKAIGRKVCEKTFKVKYTSIDSLVLGGNYSPTLGAYICMITDVDHVTGSVTTTPINIAEASTVKDVCDAIETRFKLYSAGYGNENASNTIEPFTISVYKQFSGNVESLLLYTMNLYDEIVEIRAQAEMKMQNRSSSSTGSASTDVVDSNPVQGYVFAFSGIPKTRDVIRGQSGSTAAAGRAYRFGSITARQGINLVRAAQLPNEYKEPVVSKSFYNCTGVQRIRLEPGQIKYYRSSYKNKLNVVKLLQKIQLLRNEPGNEARVTRAVGGGSMFAFEDVINVNGSNNISITYELEHTVAAVSYTRKKGAIMPFFVTDIQNNVPT